MEYDPAQPAFILDRFDLGLLGTNQTVFKIEQSGTLLNITIAARDALAARRKQFSELHPAYAQRVEADFQAKEDRIVAMLQELGLHGQFTEADFT